MERARYVSHKGRRILYVDYSGIRTVEELESAARVATNLVQAEPPDSVLALLDLDDPRRVIRRGDEWVFAPETDYERHGDVDDVVFPCGWVHDPSTDQLHMYYGAADTCLALATASLSDVLAYLRGCSQTP